MTFRILYFVLQNQNQLQGSLIFDVIMGPTFICCFMLKRQHSCPEKMLIIMSKLQTLLLHARRGCSSWPLRKHMKRKIEPIIIEKHFYFTLCMHICKGWSPISVVIFLIPVMIKFIKAPGNNTGCFNLSWDFQHTEYIRYSIQHNLYIAKNTHDVLD